VVKILQPDGFTDRLRVGATVQQLVSLNRRFIHSVLFYERCLRQKHVNRIRSSCPFGIILFFVVPHNRDCTLTIVRCLQKSLTSSNFMLWLS